jgi:catechol 2,3-dioxygenase
MDKHDQGNKLSTGLAMGGVTLSVSNLENMAEFYSDVVGLGVMRKTDTEMLLGSNSVAILNLVLRADLQFPQDHSVGLYHAAILFETQAALAKSIGNIFKKAPHTFSGSGDHLVSQAFYFTDPEGNGMELYFDRPRSEWIWKNGQVQMATLYIDPVDFLQKHLDLTNTNNNARVGHVHLKVGSIDEAKKFYVDVLGFDITAVLPQSDPSALFVSAGGYHHHLGMNTWESLGAGVREETLGLGRFEIVLGDKIELENVVKRLKTNNIDVKEMGDTCAVLDPWANVIVLSPH